MYRITVAVYDSLAMDNARTRFENSIRYASSVSDCVSRSPVCVITTQADEFKTIGPDCITYIPTTIIDCWRMLDSSKFDERIIYVAPCRNLVKQEVCADVSELAVARKASRLVAERLQK